MSKRDFYEVLGVSKDVDKKELKKAYRKVAMKHHPDRNEGDKASEEKFKEASEAYEILSDPDKKSRYDQFGHNAFEGAGGFGAGSMNMDDIFSQFGDIFGSAFGSSFGGFGRSGQTRVRGSNLRIKVKLSLDEIINGVEKKIKVNRKILSKDAKFSNCLVCNGSGQVTKITNTILGRMQSSSICANCNGLGQSLSHKPSGADSNGMLNYEETVSIKIPPGVEEGMQLKVSGKGNESNNKNGSSGDLLVLIEELPNDDFVREGKHLHYDLYISISEATLGISKDINLIGGKVRIKLESGIQSGKTPCQKGK